jgi:membrane protein
VFAAVGFGILKVVGTYYAQRVSQSPTFGVFGTVIGTLVWLNLTARLLVYSAAWTACDRIFTEGVPAPLLGLSTEADLAEAPVRAGAPDPAEAPDAATTGEQVPADVDRDREATG